MKLPFMRRESRSSAERVEPRASLENPSTSLSNPDAWLHSVVGGGPTAAGPGVSPSSAMSFGPVYACITLISETIAQLPLVLYRTTSTGRTVVTDHPSAELIRQPRPGATPYRWKEFQTGQALGWGNGYALIERDGLFRPRRLRTLLAERTRIDLIDGEIVPSTLVNGVRKPMRIEDVLHIPAFSTDSLMGVSPIRLHAESIGAGIAARDFGASFYGNGAALGGVLKHPKELSGEAKARLKASWDRLKGGGYQGIAVLEEGLEYERIGIAPDDAQFIETRKFSRSEIAQIYKVPPHMIGDLEKATFSNIVEQSIEYTRYTMMPWVIRWEQELDLKLLTAEERAAGYFFKFTVNGLLRGTQKDRYDAYNVGINAGFMSRNEVRRLEDMNDVEGLDDFLQPLNMVAVGAEPPHDESPGERALFQQIEPIVRRACEAVASMANQALVRQLKKGTDDFAGRAVRWVQSTDTVAAIARHFVPIQQVLGADDLAERFADEFMRERRDAIDAAHNDPMQTDLADADRYFDWLAENYGAQHDETDQ